MAPGIAGIPFAFPGLPKIRAFFTTRIGGSSAEPYAGANMSWDVGDAKGHVLANRQAVQAEQGFASWAEARQVHGVDMVIEPEPMAASQRPVAQADGLATARPGLALAIKTADCQPILLAHAGGRHVAALHCGWRGNRQAFPQKGVAAFCAAFGLQPADVSAVRGPSLGPGASEFVNFDQEWDASFQDYFDPATRNMDLWRLTRDQLRQAGLRGERIFSIDLCTFGLPDTFFSYRRDKITGRQLGLIWIAPD